MLSRCANPGCGSRFRYLSEGKIFIAEWVNQGDICDLADSSVAIDEPWGRREMFWLCTTCSQTLTLTVKGSEVAAVPRTQLPSAGDQPLRELRISG